LRGALAASPPRAASYRRVWARLETERVLGYVLLLPAVVYIALLIGYPFGLALWIALSNQTVGNASTARFIGLDNFVWAVQNTIFQSALRNTIMLTIGTEIVKMVLGTILAFLLIRPFKGRTIARALIIIPWAIPIAISVIAWRWMFDSQYSVINWALVNSGLVSSQAKPNWLGDPNIALWSVAAVNVWRGVPFSAIIVMAGLSSIPPELLEAARLDGASFLQRWRMIIVPLIAPILFISLLFSVVFTLTDMTVVYLLTGGGPVNSTHVLSSLAFQVGVRSTALSRGAAISLFLFPVVLALAFWLLRLLKRRDDL
jgi:multiple sugar transport system permease protein